MPPENFKKFLIFQKHRSIEKNPTRTDPQKNFVNIYFTVHIILLLSIMTGGEHQSSMKITHPLKFFSIIKIF